MRLSEQEWGLSGPGNSVNLEKLKKLEGAVFDMDGTLTDSMFIWDTVGENYLKARGIEPPWNLRELLRPMSQHQAAEYFIEEYGIKATVQEIVEDINLSIEDFYQDEVMLKPGTADMLEKFRRAGVKMCMATATDRRLVEAALIRNSIRGYFRDIFTCGEMGAGKDSPHIYRAAIASLETPKGKTYIFEDAFFAVQTAKADGMLVAAVEDESAVGQRQALRELADVYIEDWSHLL